MIFSLTLSQATPAHMTFLLGDSPLLESINRALRSGPTSNGVLLLLAGAVALIAIVVIAMRFSSRRAPDSVERGADMFTQALARLGLSRAEQSDLRYVAQNASVREPAAILLSPHGLATAAEWALKDADPERRKRVAALCGKLFGEELPPVGPVPS